ncbi:hypothetical protein [Sphingomonas sp. Leaf257]|jgi:hypothetical protein|uniref:hypothetical protein n=1 Tax=Sphingomonas sp. Leaf257 TaxID=1736309 RepID=UPI0006F52596|nr:hypothetical protein [Sphingomonas sp. Leaf257]KQO58579.1 hypothetical protein ASF14_01180 [Sphingomonas sp. Leaf257]
MISIPSGAKLRIVVCLLLPTVPSGCATAPSADLTGFGRAASTLQTDTTTTFAEANRLTRSVEVDRFVRSGAIGLSERRFPAAVPPEVAAKWRGALGDLARYGNLLATLTGRGRGGVQTDAFRELGVQLNAGPTAAGLDPGVSAGFVTLAGALVDLRAQSSARDILRRTDPEVRTLLTAMADAVGRNDSEGLRGTVASNWAMALSVHQRAYAAAATEKADARQRQIVSDYLAGIDRRDAQLAALAGLRASLLGLADAHTAAANGSRRPFGEVLKDINDRLDRTETTYRAIEKAGDAR